MFFCFVQTTRELEHLLFLSRKARNFFPEFNIRLYDKNSESDYLFFPPPNQNIFFRNIGNQNIFLERKTYPLPPPRTWSSNTNPTKNWERAWSSNTNPTKNWEWAWSSNTNPTKNWERAWSSNTNPTKNWERAWSSNTNPTKNWERTWSSNTNPTKNWERAWSSNTNPTKNRWWVQIKLFATIFIQ